MRGFRILDLILGGEIEFDVEIIFSTTSDQVVGHSYVILVGHAWFLGSRRKILKLFHRNGKEGETSL